MEINVWIGWSCYASNFQQIQIHKTKSAIKYLNNINISKTDVLVGHVAITKHKL
jgi:hypothetical protein